MFGTRLSPVHRAVLLGVTAVVLSTVAATAPAQAVTTNQIRFVTTDVPGGTGTQINSINAHGVLGGSFAVDGQGHDSGFVGSGSHFTTIEIPGMLATDVAGINNALDAVGEYIPLHGLIRHGFLRTSSGHTTVIDDPSAGTSTNPEYLQGTFPDGINNHGVITGSYIDNNDIDHGFIYQSGHFTTVDAPGAGTGPAEGTQLDTMNDSGTAVGQYFTQDNSIHSFLYRNGHITPFKAPAAGTGSFDGTWVTAISNTGSIIGQESSGKNGQTSEDFVDRDGRFNSIDDPDGTGSTSPFGINPAGTVIVGSFYTDDDVQHGFVGYLPKS